MVRQSTAAVLSAAMALGPYSSALAATTNGTVAGDVTVEGQPLSGMGLALVDLKSGEIHRTKSDARGKYSLSLSPGEYVVTSQSLAGLAVGKAPLRVVVEPGRAVVASLDLMKLPIVYALQEPPAATAEQASSGNIKHDPIGCMVAGQFPLIEAVIEPAASVARARVYFKSALGSAYYFVEMTLVDGKFVGKLPKPKIEASPITYYVQATTTEFGESQTPESEAIVVADESECGDRKVAPIGPPGAVTVFSATTAAVAVPVGFAAGGLAIAGGTIALVTVLVGGGLLAATQIGGESPSPSPLPSPSPVVVPSPSPSPSPTPTPTPSPSPSPTPLPLCSYNETNGNPTNCPCAPGPFTSATNVVTGQLEPVFPKSCADIGAPTR